MAAWKVLCTIFIHSMKRITKLTRLRPQSFVPGVLTGIRNGEMILNIRANVIRVKGYGVML